MPTTDLPGLFASLPAALRDELGRWQANTPSSAEVFAAVEGHTELHDGFLRALASSAYFGWVVGTFPELWLHLVDGGGLQRAVPLDGIPALSPLALGAGLPEAACARALRVLRHAGLARVIFRDVAGLATVDESLADLSALADVLIRAALEWSDARGRERHGTPRHADGSPASLGIVAMGKLGGRELNFSSDVDLVFLYTDEGQSDGPAPVANEDYFRGVAQRLVGLLIQRTAEGFVYRVDVRLRPFGDSGPLAVSVPALEQYLTRHGRDWERYAWIKARVVNDWPGTASLERDLLRPFVYRRYLDYGVFASLREMKAMIEAEVGRREFQANLKLGPGGIREIEFIVQCLQLVRAGGQPDLRDRELLRVLPRLARRGWLPAEAVERLLAAYRFLRSLENRVQAVHDRQTHDVPDEDLDRARVALAMRCPGWPELAAELARHREAVQAHFREVVFRVEEPAAAAVTATPPPAEGVDAWRAPLEEGLQALARLGFTEAAAAQERLRRLRAASVIQRLDEPGRQRLDLLMPAVLRIAARQPESLRALDGVTRVIEAIGRRSAYFALLNENPAACRRLVELCGLSGFLADQLAAHPLLLDELLDPRIFTNPPTHDDLVRDLAQRLAGADDPERQLDALRNFQQAARFRIAVADLSGALPLMKVSDRLTETAELLLQAAIDISWRDLAARHGAPHCVQGGAEREARFAIVAYGKLGGLELGYGSDLDIVFLHDSAGDVQETRGPAMIENDAFFARLARRVVSVVTLQTGSGHLYEVDTRLRPSGRAGLLVSSLVAFDRYQREDAWTWEHQALLRARGVAGSPALCRAFEELRVRALCQYPRRDRLKADVLDMRERMRVELARGTPELFDVKHDRGGITDIEFLVQYLALREAGRFPELVRYSDNIRQLEALAARGILPAGRAALLTDHYRRLRERLHHLALAGEPGFISRAEAAPLAEGVLAAWSEVFGC